MADIVDKKTRSRMMSGIKGKNTKPEIVIRKALFAKGFRFRLHDKTLPGKPDLVFPKFKAVIFAQGCFWHGHNCHLFKWPSSNEAFWKTKINRNKDVDKQNREQLLAMGWRVIEVWECAIKGKQKLDFEYLINSISTALNSKVSYIEFRGQQNVGDYMHIEFLNGPNWDTAFFKKLARNDTGKARGHQAGVVIPKDLRIFFPKLIGTPSETNPTLDSYIKAFLIVNGKEVDRVTTRYQMQTWGGTRTPETRITDNLGKLRNEADADDFLIIQRHLLELDVFRLTLITKKSDAYSIVESLAGKNRCGVLGPDAPMTESDLVKCEEEIEKHRLQPFELFEDDVQLIESRAVRVARDVAFRIKVLEQYGNTCAFCKETLKSPKGFYELDAAHIVPRSATGTNDVRNGLALCKRHHWAFDNGLMGVGEDRKIYISSAAEQLPENKPLAELKGMLIAETKDEELSASPYALEWHMGNIYLGGSE